MFIQFIKAINRINNFWKRIFKVEYRRINQSGRYIYDKQRTQIPCYYSTKLWYKIKLKHTFIARNNEQCAIKKNPLGNNLSNMLYAMCAKYHHDELFNASKCMASDPN